MKLWLLRYRLKYRFTRKQKAAMAGKIPMTEPLFWECLDISRKRFEEEKFWKLWNNYPKYIDAFFLKLEEERRDPNSPRYKKEEQEWKILKEKLVQAFGEDWVAQHCKE